MQFVAPSSNIAFKSITATPSHTVSHRLAQINNIQCVASRFDASATNAINPPLSSTANNFASGGIGKSRADWQSSCAILASKVESEQQNADKSTAADKITVVNGHSTSMADVRAQNALAEVQEFTSFLRVLGSYPMDMTPWPPSQ
ncbi:hypothetical protein L1987_45414 [Smallanthus sonchifolius]|uniref:Uncharacterized protein n=1 Tax=Smallanthus sonchifolius TaxID=185202 RepID=A0ACB9FX02_9ASTR|nr:hypothetical protein L1987_45414 [Smallanthus sonchifolius]